MFRRLSGLLCNERGHASTALLMFLMPALLLAGMGLDFSYGWALKSQLFTYAETAAAKSIGPRSRGLLRAVEMNNDGLVPEGADEARALFMESLPDAFVDRGVGVKTAVRRTRASLVAEITFKTELPTHVLRFFGIPTLKISGTSVSEKHLDPYHDFYLFLDNSPSMGIASSEFDRELLKASTPNGCIFACHVTDGSDSTFHVARRVGVQTRMDMVTEGMKRVLRNLLRQAQFPGQLKVATYSFGRDAADNPPQEVSGPTADLAAASRALRDVGLMTLRRPGYRGDMVSDFDAALTGLSRIIGTAGDGQTADRPRKTLVMVTDGLSNSRKPDGCSQRLRYTRCQQPVDRVACEALKAQGVAIAILYTPYPDLDGNAWYDRWIAPFAAKIGPALQDCATPGLYAEAPQDTDIASRLSSLLEGHLNLDRKADS